MSTPAEAPRAEPRPEVRIEEGGPYVVSGSVPIARTRVVKT